MEDRAGGREPTPDRVTQRRSGLGSRPVVRAAFGASVAVHVLAVLAYPALSRRIDPGGVAFPFAAGAGQPQGVEVIELVEVDVVEDLERPEDPEEIERVEAAPVEIQRPALAVSPGAVELPLPGLTPAERLRPRLTDRRLWAPLPPEFSELTIEQREELLIAGRLQEWQDSVNAAAAAAAAWTDWTFEDADGGRWGVSERGLHLGDLTLPLPQFEAPYGRRDYMWQWNEIARQGAQAAVQESVRERMEAIRARRDAERARERATPPADSTGN